MMMTTLGSEHRLQTAEGRMFIFLLLLCAFAVFGYTTTILAAFFIGREAANSQADIAAPQTIEAFLAENTSATQ